MPFVMVYGIPAKTPTDEIKNMRWDIVQVVHSKMEVPKNWIRPFFPLDMLDEPSAPDEGSSTIYVCLDTAMFSGVQTDEKKQKALSVTAALAELIWSYFDGTYEVEVMIGTLDPELKCLIEAKPRLPRA